MRPKKDGKGRKSLMRPDKENGGQCDWRTLEEAVEGWRRPEKDKGCGEGRMKPNDSGGDQKVGGDWRRMEEDGEGRLGPGEVEGGERTPVEARERNRNDLRRMAKAVEGRIKPQKSERV